MKYDGNSMYSTMYKLYLHHVVGSLRHHTHDIEGPAQLTGVFLCLLCVLQDVLMVQKIQLKLLFICLIRKRIENLYLWPRWSSGLCARLPSEGCGFKSHLRLCLVTCCDAGTTPLGHLSPYSLGDLAKDREGYCQNNNSAWKN